MPVYTLPPGEGLPPAPDTAELWPAALLAFLNANPANVTRLAALLAEWFPNSPAPWIDSSFDIYSMELNGDGREELLVFIKSDYAGPPEGWVIVFQQEAAGQFTLAWSRPAALPELLVTSDLNGDGLLDFVYGDTFSGAHTATVWIVPVGWNGQVFIDFSLEPIASTNVYLDEVRIEDTTGDGRPEIIIHGGTYGSAGAGPNRASTFTYTWSEDGYVLLSQEPDLPQEYYFFLLKANERLVAGDWEAAVAIYVDSLFSENAIYDGNVEHQRAFAEFQLMLAYLLLGDETTAATWATSGHYPNEFYSEVKQIFWESYQANHDWTTAAEAARRRVRLAGIDRIQLIPWVGYANSSLTLEQICPCVDCLQGSIGSQFGP
jgi:hypothetical protein